MLRDSLTLLAAVAILALAGCEQPDAPQTGATQQSQTQTTPGSAVAPVTISGRVESTDPKAFATASAQPDRPLPWLELFGSPAYADVSFYAVVDVPVRVYPIASAGYIYGPPVAVATTSSTGYYEAVMPPTYVYQPVTEYVLVAGGPVIYDRIDDWGDVGDFALRALVLGLTNQVISPVSDVVYVETIPVARVQTINVRTIPVQQVMVYQQDVYRECHEIVLAPGSPAPVVLTEIRTKIKGNKHLLTERDRIFALARTMTSEDRAQDARSWEQSRQRLQRDGKLPTPAQGRGVGAPDQARTDRADGQRGHDQAPRRDSGSGQAEKPDRGGGQAEQPKRGGGGGQAAKPNRGGGGGQAEKPNRGGGGGHAEKPNRGGGGGQAEKPNRGGGGGHAEKPNRGGGGGQAEKPNHGGSGGQAEKPNRGGGGGQAEKPNRGGGGGHAEKPNRGGGGGQAEKPNRGGGGGQAEKPNRGGGGGQAEKPNRGGGGGQAEKPNRGGGSSDQGGGGPAKRGGGKR